LPGHEGIDFYLKEGDNVYAVNGGKVFSTGWSNVYGYNVRVDHGGGYQTIYAHLSRVCVNVGESVPSGTVLGLGGSTGRSTGPHLHLTLKKDDSNEYPFDIINPTKYIRGLLNVQDS
jgi:murein DD-endopeptidase MepM/ murein hydrolase activator NlpD